MTGVAEDDADLRAAGGAPPDRYARVASALVRRGLLAELDAGTVVRAVLDVALEETPAALAVFHPGRDRPAEGFGRPVRSELAVPVAFDGDEVFGALALGHPAPEAFGEADRLVAEELARHAAEALHRCRLVADADAAARRERGHAAAMRSLAEAAVRLNAPLPIEAMLRDVTGTARRIVGARCAVTTVAGEAAVLSPASFVSCADGPACPVVHDAGPAVPGVADAVRSADRLAAPLRSPQGREVGLLQLFAAEGTPFTETDEAIVVQLAQLAASAIEKERLLEAQVRLARTLQRSLLPERLPDVPGVEMAARYAPGAAEADVGGDWYDALTLPDGDLFLVIGDVVGKGVEAAAAMGQLRHCLRTYAFEGLEPAAALQRLNVLVNTLGGSEFATVLAARLTPATGLLRFASAGHPPPLLLPPSGIPEYLEGARSVPIGTLPHPEWEEGRRTLAPGSALVLYTDGLVESRTLRLDEGLARLAEAAAEGGDPSAVADRLLATAGLEDQSDDSAVLAVRLTACAEQFRLRLPADYSSVSVVRRHLRAFLGACGLDDQATDEVTLACSEAAANAVEHPVAPRHHSIEVEASVEEGTVRVVVRDFGRWRTPPSASDRGRGLALMGMLMDVEVQSLPSGTEVVLRRTGRDPAGAGGGPGGGPGGRS